MIQLTDQQKRNLSDKNTHISTEEIECDVDDTNNEIEALKKDLQPLLGQPLRNKLRINMLEHQINKRQIFVEKLQAILEIRSR
jgi:hypothetical protein